MEFDNREPDETVNYAIEHPLKEFAWLIFGVLGSLALATVLLGYFAGEVAARLPYRYEESVSMTVGSALQARPQTNAEKEAERELNALASRLVQHMPLPEGMRIAVHYDNSSAVNAYATLGGNVVILRGLLAKVGSENALAMVLAHEIAHAQLRHPVRSVGRGVAVGILLAVLNAGMGQSVASNVVGMTGSTVLLRFSRDQEREADAAALEAVAKLYGHVGGAKEVFQMLERESHDAEAVKIPMLSTHPLSQERIDNLDALAKERGWLSDGQRAPLATALLASSAQSMKPEVR